MRFAAAEQDANGTTDGLAEVQRLDKVGFSLLFADESFRKTYQQPAVSKLIKRFSNAIRVAYPSAPSLKGLDDADAWAEKAFKLKQRLMLSPKDYRIHFCLPGTPFDPTWMTAENDHGLTPTAADTKGKTIRVCLFPALVEQDSKAFGKDAVISDALVKNKNFFPTWQEKQALDPKSVISKAVVLVM